jgi:hypothetical protein
MSLKPLELAFIAEVVTLIWGARRLAGLNFFVTRHPPPGWSEYYSIFTYATC